MEISQQPLGLVDTHSDDQEARGIPVSGTYIKLDNSIFEMPYTVGVGGIWGELKDTSAGTLSDKYLDVWATTVGLTLKINKTFSFKTEGYIGANLAAFRSTNNSSIDGHKSLRSRGGFAQLNIKLSEKDNINIRGGIDDV